MINEEHRERRLHTRVDERHKGKECLESSGAQEKKHEVMKSSNLEGLEGGHEASDTRSRFHRRDNRGMMPKEWR